MRPFRRPRFSLSWGTALLAFGLFLGCTPSRSRVASSPQKSVPDRETEDLVRDLARRIDRFRSLRSLAKVRYRSEDERGGFQVALLIRRPHHLRLEALSLFGVVVLIVTANGDEVAGFRVREGVFYRGKSSRENLFRFTRIPLALRELDFLLMGLPPVEMQGTWKGKDHSIRRGFSGGRNEEVMFDPASGMPVGWKRLSAAGRVEVSASFSDFSPTPSGPFPLKIAVESKEPEQLLEIRYKEPEINVPLPLSLFVQDKPSSAREVLLDPAGG